MYACCFELGYFFKVAARITPVDLAKVDKKLPYQYIFTFKKSDLFKGMHCCVLDSFDETEKNWVLFNSWGQNEHPKIRLPEYYEGILGTESLTSEL